MAAVVPASGLCPILELSRAMRRVFVFPITQVYFLFETGSASPSWFELAVDVPSDVETHPPGNDIDEQEVLRGRFSAFCS